MFNIKVEGIDKVSSYLDSIVRKELPFAISKALNSVAKEVKIAEVATINQVFDRPTPYIQKGIYIWPSTKTRLSVEVYFKDRQAKLLEPHVIGGGRGMKRSERLMNRFWVPGKGARLNKYGNISSGQITQILSVLGLSADPYQNITSRSRKRNKNPRDYFLIRTTTGRLLPGVYERTLNKSLKPVLIFINNPQYRKIYPFFEVGQRVVDASWKQIFHEALDYAIRTSH